MNGNQSSRNDVGLRSWSHQQIACVRLAVGIWLLLLAAIIYDAGVGGRWAWLLVGAAVLHFGLAYRLFRIAKDDPDRRARFR